MAELETSAEIVLSLHPDWRRPVSWLPALSVYTAAAPLDGDTCLCLDARQAELPHNVLRTMVGGACDALAEGREFPDVLLVEDETDLRALATPVAGAAELADRLGLRVVGPDGAGAVVEHARWAKGIVDACQAMVDQALLAAAPAVSTADEPLVSVRIATYGDPSPLIDRTLPSVLRGPYRNIEVLVCGDGPHPQTRGAVEGIGDPRVRYLETEARGPYPRIPRALWQTGGIPPMNRCLDEARGDFVAPLDHDDVFLTAHVPELLALLGSAGADMAYGQAVTEYTTGAWGVIGAAPLRFGRIVHAAVLYSRRLLHMRYDPHAWLIDEPGDWNMWRRMAAAGASIAFLPAPVAVHFREGSSALTVPPADPSRHVEELARDVLATSAGELLSIASPSRGARLELASG